MGYSSWFAGICEENNWTDDYAMGLVLGYETQYWHRHGVEFNPIMGVGETRLIFQLGRPMACDILDWHVDYQTNPEPGMSPAGQVLRCMRRVSVVSVASVPRGVITAHDLDDYIILDDDGDDE